MSTAPSNKLLQELRQRTLRGEVPHATSGQTAASWGLEGRAPRLGSPQDRAEFLVSHQMARDLLDLFQALGGASDDLFCYDTNGARYDFSYWEESIEDRRRRSWRGPINDLRDHTGFTDHDWVKHASLWVSATFKGRPTRLYYSLHPELKTDQTTGSKSLVFYLGVRCDPFRLYGGQPGAFLLPPEDTKEARQYLINFYTAGFGLLETLGALPGVRPLRGASFDRPRRFTWDTDHRERLRRGEVRLTYISVVKTSRVTGAKVGPLLQVLAAPYAVQPALDGTTNQLTTWSLCDHLGIHLERLDQSQPEGDYRQGFALVEREGSRNIRCRLELRPVRMPKKPVRRKRRRRKASRPEKDAIEVLAQIHARWFDRHDEAAYRMARDQNGGDLGFTVAAFVDLTLRGVKPEDSPEQVVTQHHLYLQHCMERIMTEQTQITPLMSTSYDMLLSILTPGGRKRHPFVKNLAPAERKLITAWRAGKLHDGEGRFLGAKTISQLIEKAVPTVYVYKRKLREKGIDIEIPEAVYLAVAQARMEASLRPADAARRNDVDGLDATVRDELTKQARRQCRRLEKTLKQLADHLDSAKDGPKLRPQVIALGKKNCLVKPKRVVRRADLLIPQIEGM